MNGGPVPDSLCEAIFATAQHLSSYKILEVPDIDLSQQGKSFIGSMQVDILDPVADYVALMQEFLISTVLLRLLPKGSPCALMPCMP